MSRLLAAAAFLLLMIATQSLPAATIPEQYTVWGKQAKAHAFLGDPGLDTPGTASPVVSAAEKEAGVFVFAHAPFDLIDPDFVPPANDRCTALSVHDCPGQYGAVSFAVFALQKATITVAATDLAGKNGQSISSANLDIRDVRCVKATVQKKTQVFPLLLETFDKKAIAANRLQQFWITYYIPPKTPAGNYAGRINLSVDGKQLPLPISVHVYPFDLVEPDTNLYVYYNCDHKPERCYTDLLDQRLHGMNMGTIDSYFVSEKGDLVPKDLAAMLDAYAKVGFSRKTITIELSNRVIAEWLNTPDKSIGMYAAWSRYYPTTSERDQKYVAMVKTVNDEVTKRGLKLIIAASDEAGSHPWTQKPTQHYYQLLKDKLPQITRELTVGGGWAMKYPEEELWKGLLDIWTTNRWLPDKLDIVRKENPGVKIQIYNMGGSGSGPGGLGDARVVFGFFNWKARVDGTSQWVYHFTGQDVEPYTWAGQDESAGRVPTLRWEAVREGAKDRRYLATLDSLLGQKKGKAADQAKKFLEDIAAKIELKTTDYDPIAGGRVPALDPATYDQWRLQIGDFIERLKAGNE